MVVSPLRARKQRAMASAAIRAAMMSKNNGEGFADLETVQSKIDHYREHPEALTTWLFDCRWRRC